MTGVRSRCLVLIGMLAALLLAPASARAQDVRLPPIDLHLFIDRSQSIYDINAKDSPHKQIFAVLPTLLLKPLGEWNRPLLVTGDNLYLYTFGDGVSTARKVEVGSDLGEALNDVDDDVRQTGVALTTEFDTLLASIAANPAIRPRPDERLRIVVIASDFVHERAKKLTNSPDDDDACDLVDNTNGAHWQAIKQRLQALSDWTASDQPAGERIQYPVLFVSLLIVHEAKILDEYRRKGSQRWYPACVREALQKRPVNAQFESLLSAKTIGGNSFSKDIRALGEHLKAQVNQAALMPLSIDQGGSRCYGLAAAPRMHCELALRNPGSAENAARRALLRSTESAAPVATVPFTTEVRVPSRSVSPRPPVIGTLDFGKADAARLAPLGQGKQVFVSIQDDSGRVARPVPVRLEADAPLEIESARVERTSKTDPYRLRLTVRNRNGLAKEPLSVALYRAASGQDALSPAIKVLASGTAAAGDLKEGDQRELETEPLPAAVAALISPDQPLFVELAYRNAVSGMAVSGRQRIAVPDLRPLTVTRARAEPSETAPGGWRLTVEAASPDSGARAVEGLQVLGGPPNDLRALHDNWIAPIGSASLGQATGSVVADLPLGVAERLVLRDTLTVQLSDAVTEKPSQPYAIEVRSSVGGALKPAGKPDRVDAAAGHLSIAVKVAKDGRGPAAVAKLRLRPITGAAAAVDIRVEPRLVYPDREAPLVQGSIPMSALGELADQRQARLSIVDTFDGEGTGTIDIDLPKRPALAASDAHFGPDGNGNIAVVFTVRNPGVRPATLTGASLGDRPDEVPLTVRQIEIQSGPQGTAGETVTAPLPVQDYARVNPGRAQRLWLKEANPDEPPKSVTVAPVQDIALHAREPRLTDDGQSLQLRVVNPTFQNPAPHKLYLKRVLLAASKAAEPIELESDGPVEIPPGDSGTLVRLKLDSLHQKWLGRILDTGADIAVVAPLSLIETLPDPAPRHPADDRWATLSIPRPKAVDVRVEGEPGQVIQDNQLKVKLENTGGIVNHVTGLRLWDAKTRKVIVDRLPLSSSDTPVPVLPGDPVTVTSAKLKPDQLARLYQANKVVIQAVDGTKTTAMPESTSGNTAVLDVFDIVVTEELVQAVVAGQPHYTVIKANLAIRRQDGTELTGRQFKAHLVLGSDKTPRSIEFEPRLNGTNVPVTLAWKIDGTPKLANSSITFESADVELRKSPSEHAIPAEPKEVWANTLLLGFGAIGSYIFFVALVLVTRRIHLRAGNLSWADMFHAADRVLTAIEKWWKRLAGAFAIVVALLGTSFAVFTWTDFKLGSSIGNAIFVVALIVLMGSLAIFMFWRLITAPCATLIRKGEAPVAYEVLAHRQFKVFTRCVLAVGAVLFVIWWMAHASFVPYDPSKADFQYPNKSQQPVSRTADRSDGGKA